MTRAGGYVMIALGVIASCFGAIGLLFGLPILFAGAVVVVRRSLGL